MEENVRFTVKNFLHSVQNSQKVPQLRTGDIPGVTT
jgi:hypothetical protein